MYKIIQDDNFVYTKLCDFLKKYFPGCELYAHGSRVEKITCDKCDFDIIIRYPPGQKQLVKFLQEAKIYGNRFWKKKALERLKGRSLYQDRYHLMLFQVYIDHVQKLTEQAFNYKKDEFGNSIKVDLMFAFLPLSKHKPAVRLDT